ncbi:MAG: Fe-Mn family superoxide dismutase [Polyangiales bacterium]
MRPPRQASPTRRELLLGAGAAVLGGCATQALAVPRAPAEGSPPRRVEHRMLPLPFAAGSLAGISERMITSHHENNYGGAVRNLTRAEQELDALPRDAPGFVVAALHERVLTFRNSTSLHEMYFGNLGGDGRRPAAVNAMLADAYGSDGAWEQRTRAAAMGLGGGSGWVVLAMELDTRGLRTFAVSHHTQSLSGSVPLLVLDLYEHSYQMDFGAAVARYVDAFFANVRWDEVHRRAELARRAYTALSSGAQI